MKPAVKAAAVSNNLPLKLLVHKWNDAFMSYRINTKLGQVTIWAHFLLLHGISEHLTSS